MSVLKTGIQAIVIEVIELADSTFEGAAGASGKFPRATLVSLDYRESPNWFTDFKMYLYVTPVVRPSAVETV